MSEYAGKGAGGSLSTSNPYKFLRILLYAVGNNVKEDQSFDEQKYFRDPASFKKF